MHNPPAPTGAIAFADGTVFMGTGLGATGLIAGELCFNTAMTGYQEILTDPSYAEQIVTFTFPHIGNVGANPEDEEAASAPARRAAIGAVFRAMPTAPSNWRAVDSLSTWLSRRGIIGLAGVDTRAITLHIREKGMPRAAIAHAPQEGTGGQIDRDALIAFARAWQGLEGKDLTPAVATAAAFRSLDTLWTWQDGHSSRDRAEFHVVVVDFGVKANILRALGAINAHATVVGPAATAAEIRALKPDGLILSNGPGDPAATALVCAPMIRELVEARLPTFGICLGHQILALTFGANTMKMGQGHHGANHPVKDVATGKVEIVSMNHGFAVDRATLPDRLAETHVSLFDGTNCGIRLVDRPAFAVQHHPEASPGPQDSLYLFERFAELMAVCRSAPDY
jgi:carbamoyl-phosphate synthase small subunit